jgi:hypothetical protein
VKVIDDEEVRTTRALILYQSLFGNTAAIARSVAAGLRDALPDAVVDCRSGNEVNGVPDDVDLIVLGAPTHFWGLPRGLTRTMELQYEKRIMPAARAEVRRAATTTGIPSGFGPLPPGRGRAAAAFDTQMTGPLTGGARRAIAGRLRRAGYRLVAEPQTFLVEAVAGPLRAGETERARAWGLILARALDTEDTSNRRQTMERTNQRSMTVLDPDLDQALDLTEPRRPTVDVTRVLTTAEVVLGAVLVARYLSRRPGSSKALVTMGPGGWVSMKGGTVAVRRGSRPWARPRPLQPHTTGHAPLWARVLSAVPLQALMR